MLFFDFTTKAEYQLQFCIQCGSVSYYSRNIKEAVIQNCSNKKAIGNNFLTISMKALATLSIIIYRHVWGTSIWNVFFFSNIYWILHASYRSSATQVRCSEISDTIQNLNTFILIIRYRINFVFLLLLFYRYLR